MTVPEVTVPEESSRESGILRDMLKDPEYIASVKARLKAGTAKPYEIKMLAERRRLEPEEDERRKRIRGVVDLMTKAERRLLADVLLRFRSIGVDL